MSFSSALLEKFQDPSDNERVVFGLHMFHVRTDTLIENRALPIPIGSMYMLYMVTWIPSIYPSHVSIFLSAPWILWVYEIIFSMVLESLRIVPNIWAIGKQVIFQHGLHRSHGFELMDHMIPWSHHEEKPRLVCLFLLDIFFFDMFIVKWKTPWNGWLLYENKSL